MQQARSNRQSSTVLDDFKQIESRLVARIQELEASAAELAKLRDVADRLGIDVPGANESALPSRGRGAGPFDARGRSAPSSRTRAPRHAQGGKSRVTRRDRVLELVRAQPGISVPELVDAMGVNRTSLYPVVRQLISDGLVHKSGKYLTLVDG